MVGRRLITSAVESSDIAGGLTSIDQTVVIINPTIQWSVLDSHLRRTPLPNFIVELLEVWHRRSLGLAGETAYESVPALGSLVRERHSDVRLEPITERVRRVAESRNSLVRGKSPKIDPHRVELSRVSTSNNYPSIDYIRVEPSFQRRAEYDDGHCLDGMIEPSEMSTVLFDGSPII